MPLDGAGNVECWGSNSLGGADDAPDGFFEATTTGFSHSCVLAESGAVDCWGRSEGPLDPPPEYDFVQIDAGDDYACGVTTEGV